MNPWRTKINVSDVFHNDELTLAQKASSIANRLRAKFPADDELDDLLFELEEAGEHNSTSYFDAVWDGVYDWADAKRVWIETWAAAVTS